MVELVFVQQATLLSSILLGFSFPVIAQIATLDRGALNDGTVGSINSATFDLDSNTEKPNSQKRLISGALGVFIVCAAAMLVSTFIGIALTLILSHYQVQAQPIYQPVVGSIDTLVGMWGMDFTCGGTLLSSCLCFTGLDTV